MKQRLYVVSVLSVMLIMACACAHAISFSEVDCADIPGAGGSGSHPTFLSKPYIVEMETGGATLMWQTDMLTTARIVVRGPGATGEFRTRNSKRLSSVKIAGLRPDTRYNYTVWVSSPGGNPRTQVSDAFTTYPVKNRLVNFAIYGDSRSSPERHGSVIGAMSRESNLDFVINSGDLVRDGTKIDRWVPEYFQPIEGMSGRIPFYAIRGNHDKDTFFYQLLGLPKSPKWRSFSVLGIHMICLDSQESFDVGSDQYKWLISDLVTHKAAKWKFILLHSPVYSSGPHGAVDEKGVAKETPVRTGQKLFPELARKYGIQAVFSGHDHFYERGERDGVQYIISGGGGAGTYAESNPKANPYRKVFYPGLHYCIVSVNGDKARVVVKTPEGRVLDRISL